MLVSDQYQTKKKGQIFRYQKPQEKLCQAQQLLPSYLTHYESLQQGSQNIAANISQVLEANKSDETLIQFLSKKIYMLMNNTPFVELQKALSALSSLLYQPQEQPRISQLFLNEDFPAFPPFSEQQQQQEEEESIKAEDQQQQQQQIQQCIQQQQQQLSKEISTNNKENERQLILRCFNFFGGRIPNLVRPYLCFPEFLTSVLDSLEHVFRQGPMALEYTHYIAIIGASANQNNYIFNLFAEIYFQLYKDDNEIMCWLEQGFSVLPEKLQKTWEICSANLQHPSALLTNYFTLFQHLMNCPKGFNLSSNEAIISIFIILLVENLSTVSFGHGLLEEYDCEEENKAQSKMKNSSLSSSQKNKLKQQQKININNNKNVSEFSDTQKKNNDQQLINSQSLNSENFQERSLNNLSQQNQNQQKEQETEKQQPQKQLSQQQQQGKKDLFEESKAIVSHSYSELQFLLDSDEDDIFESNQQQNRFESYIGKTQFNWILPCCSMSTKKKVKRKNQFYLTDDDYNWRNHCCAILRQLGFDQLTDFMQERLDRLKQMKFINNFSQFSNNQQQNFQQQIQNPKQKQQQQYIDKQQQQQLNQKQQQQYSNVGDCMKSAIWNYVRIVLGYKDLHCDFVTMNKLLSKNFRTFIKKLVLWPWELKLKDFELVPFKLALQDFSLIIILVSEAKLITRLLYFLHSFELYYKRKNSGYQINSF